MVIQHELFAMNSNRMYNMNVKDRARVSEKLSSGYRIHRAADDASIFAFFKAQCYTLSCSSASRKYKHLYTSRIHWHSPN